MVKIFNNRLLKLKIKNIYSDIDPLFSLKHRDKIKIIITTFISYLPSVY